MRAFGFGPTLHTPSTGTTTARERLIAAGMNPDADEMQVAVDGVAASPDTPVTPGSSVALWPKALNG